MLSSTVLLFTISTLGCAAPSTASDGLTLVDRVSAVSSRVSLEVGFGRRKEHCDKYVHFCSVLSARGVIISRMVSARRILTVVMKLSMKQVNV